MRILAKLMRLVAWNCNMALHRKLDALLSLNPDVAVISECASLETLQARGLDILDPETFLWIGNNPNKGLGIATFNGFRVSPAVQPAPYLRYILPARISGEVRFDLMGVWAQNASGGTTRKHQLGPLRRALSHYRDFVASPFVAAGDFNNNVFWDRPGWRMNHARMVERLSDLGLESAYHHWFGEAQGAETRPTLYWRDRTEEGPTYHIDYAFLPRSWLPWVREVAVGAYPDWCGAKLSDHVPLVLDIDDAAFKEAPN
jgi:exodeoxyribonuclease-3